ncbi:MAG: hypothetical protein GF350_09060, partial [Chitinivibrionales bacterium]|nr:hypothetical protein [Chitinivibrionales bacterium]
MPGKIKYIMQESIFKKYYILKRSHSILYQDTAMKTCLYCIRMLYAISLLFAFGYAQQGNSLALDGGDDYVRIPHSASLDITTAITMAAWVNISNYLEYAPVLFKGGNDDPNALTSGGNSYGIIQSGTRKGTASGRLRISCPSTGATETGATVRRYTWT